ncbi:MAG: permease, partial [Chlamydiota bacterium]
QWYARNHTLPCVVPAMFIAGAIATFLSQASVMKHLGPRSNKAVAYGVASVSGCVLAVCSCSVLPMFAGIYTMGAGLGPACAFLYSGPAINVMAIFLTARVLGFDIGLWRAVGSIAFAVVIGLLMAGIFRRGETRRMEGFALDESPPARPLWKTSLFFLCLVLFLVFSDWSTPGNFTLVMNDGRELNGNMRYETRDMVNFQVIENGEAGEQVEIKRGDIRSISQEESLTVKIHRVRWCLAGAMGLAVAVMCALWFTRGEFGAWMSQTWSFARMIVPLLFGGVFVTGFVSALIPEKAVASLVGDNGFVSNFVASFVGACWYFATLTEIPIVQALQKLGMAKGPSLALLLAGPALSIPSMLVIRSILGVKKTAVFVFLVVMMSTVVGMIFGRLG